MRKDGFTLIELMIVVSIIAVIASIAIPNLVRSRVQSNESSAIGSLHTICSAQVSYASSQNVYSTTFDALTSGTPPFLDGDWSGTKQGYNFTMGGSEDNFTCNAAPERLGTTGNRYFYVDASGVIRYSDSTDATSADNPISE